MYPSTLILPPRTPTYQLLRHPCTFGDIRSYKKILLFTPHSNKRPCTLQATKLQIHATLPTHNPASSSNSSKTKTGPGSNQHFKIRHIDRHSTNSFQLAHLPSESSTSQLHHSHHSIAAAWYGNPHHHNATTSGSSFQQTHLMNLNLPPGQTVRWLVSL